MSNEYYVVLTSKGEAELLESMTNNTIFSPSYIAVGDGSGSYYEPEKNQVALKNQTYQGSIYAQGKHFKENESDINYLYFDIQIPPSVGDFQIREAGLFNSNDELLAIAKYPLLNKLKSDSWYDRTVSIEIQIAVSDNAINTIIIDDSGNLATEEKLEEAKQELKTEIIESIEQSDWGQTDNTKKDYIKNKPSLSTVATTGSYNDLSDTPSSWDAVPLFYGTYFDYTPNNTSWLLSGGQVNSGGIYTTAYNELVNVLNGETKYGALKVIDVDDMISGVDYSEYWKVNQDDEYFICPTSIGLNISTTANLYFKVANAVENLELMDVGEVMEALANKADVDLSNTNPSQLFKNNVVSWGLPDYSSGIDVTSIVYSSTGVGYTPPKNGVIMSTGSTSDNNVFCTLYIYEGTVQVCSIGLSSGSYETINGDMSFIPVNKKYSYRIYPYTSRAISKTIMFFPLEGAI